MPLGLMSRRTSEVRMGAIAFFFPVSAISTVSIQDKHLVLEDTLHLVEQHFSNTYDIRLHASRRPRRRHALFGLLLD